MSPTITRTVFSIALPAFACLFAAGASAAPSPRADRVSPAATLNLTLPALPKEYGSPQGDIHGKKEPALWEEKIPLGYEANPVCRNGTRSTAYRIIKGKTYYKCE